MQLHILIFVVLFTPWEVEIHVSISINFSTRNWILIFYCLSNFRLTGRLKFLQSLSPWLWHCSATICWNPWPSGCRFVRWTVPNACVLGSNMHWNCNLMLKIQLFAIWLIIMMSLKAFGQLWAFYQRQLQTKGYGNLRWLALKKRCSTDDLYLHCGMLQAHNWTNKRQKTTE